MSKRKQHHPVFKTKVALEALKGEEAVSELASRFGVQSTMIHHWKCTSLEGASGVFERGGRKAAEVDDERVRRLMQLVGLMPVYQKPNIRCPVTHARMCESGQGGERE